MRHSPKPGPRIAAAPARGAIAAAACLAVLGGACGGSGEPATRTLGASAGAAGAPPLPGTAQPIDTIERGDGSLIGQPEAHLIHDDATFQALFRRHTLRKILLVLDFSQVSVVGLFDGARPLPGHGLEVVRLGHEPAAATLHALVRASAPGPWRPALGGPVTPFHLVATDAVPPGTRLAVERQEVLDWEELHAGPVSPLGATDPAFAGAVRVFRDAASLDPVWQAHVSRGGPPAVDFAREMVVLVVAPHQPLASAGATLETLAILHDPREGAIRVDAVVHPYRRLTIPPARTEAPFQFLRVARAAGPVRFERRRAIPAVELLAGHQAVHVGAQEITVIKDDATFDAVLQHQVFGNPTAGGAVPRPDFATEVVIAAFRGEQATTGFAIAVAHVHQLEDGVVEVEVHASDPPGRPLLQRTSAFHVVKMPRPTGATHIRVVDSTLRP